MDRRGDAAVARRYSPHLTALAVGVLALLAACSASPPSFSNPFARYQPSATGKPATPGTIEAFVPVALRFVESHRGLKFKQTVKVSYLDDAAFASRITEIQRRDPADTQRQAKLLRALGLVPPGVDIEKAEEGLLSPTSRPSPAT